MKKKEPENPDKDNDGIPDKEEILNRKAEDTDEEEFQTLAIVSSELIII